MDEKEQDLQKRNGEFKEWMTLRDKEFKEFMVGERTRILGVIQNAIGEIARKRGADLVLDSSGRSIGETPVPIIIHLDGIPDWTTSVFQALNKPTEAANLGEVDAEKGTVSTADLRFAMVNMSKIIENTTPGVAMTKAVNAMQEKLKALAPDGQDFHNTEQENMARGDTLRSALLGEIEKALPTDAEGGGYNVVFDSSGNSTNGVPVAVFHGNIPDVTDEVIKALGEAKPR